MDLAEKARFPKNANFNQKEIWSAWSLERMRFEAAGHAFERAETFSDRPLGTAFWYENSNGLVEIKRQPGAR